VRDASEGWVPSEGETGDAVARERRGRDSDAE